MKYKCQNCNKNSVTKKYGLCQQCKNNILSMNNISKTFYAKTTHNKKVAPSKDSSIAKKKVSITTNTNVETKQASKTTVHSHYISNTDSTNSCADNIASHSEDVLHKPNNAKAHGNQQNKLRTQATSDNSNNYSSFNSIYDMPKSNESTVKTEHRYSRTYCEGTIANLVQSTEKIGFLRKYFRCMFMGIPFCFNNNITSFDVISCDSSIPDSHVIFYDANSVLNNGKHVEVYGFRGLKNIMTARRVHLLNQNINISVAQITTPFMWLITIALIAGIVYFFNTIDWEEVKAFVIEIIVFILIVVAMFWLLRAIIRGRWR